jgi:acetylornithine deacetylase/succinyl-diaminopimelate desuccinylase-like protein
MEESLGDAAGRVASLMPELKDDLARLVAIPSVSITNYPPETHGDLVAARDVVVELLESAGVGNIDSVDLPNTAPCITGDIPGPPGSPTVLLYGHYDVVPAGDEEKWDSPPYELSERDGALFGRGSADTKSNIVAHIGALRAWGGRPPVGIKVVIEGQEEVGSVLNEYPATNPETFRADAMLIADAGSVRPGVPTLTIGLRGMSMLEVELQTLAGPKHSGQYGGAAPDAVTVLLAALATLHDENGDVAVEGLLREPWTGEAYTEEEFAELAEILPGLPLVGTGDLGSRVWSGPAITVTGIDIPSVDEALNAVNPRVRAKLSMRFHPAQDAAAGQAAVISHLERQKPFGIALTVTAGVIGNGFLADTTGPAYVAANAAMQAAWGIDASYAAMGGSIPLVNALHQAVPEAEILLLGTTDGYANIHAPNERVLLEEFEKAVLVETEFLGRFADAFARVGG